MNDAGAWSRGALIVLGAMLLAALAPVRPVDVGGVEQCRDTTASACRPVDLVALPAPAREVLLVRRVTIAPGALPLARPMMVRIVAMASGEVRWNGVVIGRNGMPAAEPARETPGRFMATMLVPPAFLRPGTNVASVRLSSHHLWLPVRRPVHAFEIGTFETAALPGLTDYLPSLLMLGAFVAAGAYFAGALALDRRDRDARLLFGVALAAVGQLGLETLRSFYNYPYPWHLPRVLGIAVLAATASVLVVAYAARRFAPRHVRRAVVATATVAVASVALVPWYDIKALVAILAAAVAVLACAVVGFRDRVRYARAGIAGAAATIVLMLVQRTQFLDQAWYLLLAALLVALVIEQAPILNQARRRHADARAHAGSLETRLHRLADGADDIVVLKEGSRSHRVAERDILSVRAADDYCEARLGDGRIILVTTTLARLLATLSDRFARIHKSHAVNRAHVAQLTVRPGGGRAVRLSDGSVLPVGRSYAGAVEPWLLRESPGSPPAAAP